MRKIIYTRPDGGLSVMTPVRNTVCETLATDEEIEQRAWSKLPKDAINPQFVDPSEIPQDRTFRNAWKADGLKALITIDKNELCKKARLVSLSVGEGPVEASQAEVFSKGRRSHQICCSLPLKQQHYSILIQAEIFTPQQNLENIL